MLYDVCKYSLCSLKTERVGMKYGEKVLFLVINWKLYPQNNGPELSQRNRQYTFLSPLVLRFSFLRVNFILTETDQ